MNSVTDLLAHPISGTWRNRPPNVRSPGTVGQTRMLPRLGATMLDGCLIEMIPRCSEYTRYTDCTPAAIGLQNDCIF